LMDSTPFRFVSVIKLSLISCGHSTCQRNGLRPDKPLH
jgi:hypothetical protein